MFVWVAICQGGHGQKMMHPCIHIEIHPLIWHLEETSLSNVCHACCEMFVMLPHSARRHNLHGHHFQVEFLGWKKNVTLPLFMEEMGQQLR